MAYKNNNRFNRATNFHWKIRNNIRRKTFQNRKSSDKDQILRKDSKCDVDSENIILVWLKLNTIDSRKNYQKK